MLGTEASDALPWRRRPRRPLPALLQDWRIWPALVILWLIAVFGGFAYAATDGVWWGRVLGAVSMLVGLTAAVRFGLHVRRPVVDDRFDSDLRGSRPRWRPGGRSSRAPAASRSASVSGRSSGPPA